MKSKQSFTLIELLIVIAIIGILSSLVILNITTGRDEANNAKRVQEANGLVKALNIYYNQNYSWPTGMTTTLREICNTNVLDSAECLALNRDVVDLSGMGDILPNIPIDPSLPSDSPVTGYWVAYNHGSNEPMVVPGLYQASCPEGYVSVPGNSYYNTLPGFCVMKWEAKNDGSGNAVSTATGTPWVSINQNDSRTECSDVGSHLITNNEWMTIARNIEAQGVNWTNSAVGDGSIFRGNSNSSAAMDGTDPLSGINTRTHTLTNGEVVWDMAGNVWNWTDEYAPVEDDRPFPSTTFPNITYWGRYSRDSIAPSDPTWSTGDGVGRYYVTNDGGTRGAFRRGGYWGLGTNAGLFTLFLNDSPTSTHTYLGFRCAR